MHVLKPSVGLNDSLQNSNPTQRITPVLVIVCRSSMLLVRSSKIGKKEQRFGLPQGGYEPSDGLLKRAAFREGNEELGLTEQLLDRSKPVVVIGECLNPVPQERRCTCVHKRLIYVAIPVWCTDWVKLNSENTKHEWVRSYGHLLARMGNTREESPVKFHAMHDVLDKVHSIGLLPWTHPSPHVIF